MHRHVIDLSWKVAHGVLYTAERLSSFGYAIPTACFCGHPLETLDHLFFSCPLADCVLSWLSSLLFLSSPSFGPILLRPKTKKHGFCPSLTNGYAVLMSPSKGTLRSYPVPIIPLCLSREEFFFLSPRLLLKKNA